MSDDLFRILVVILMLLMMAFIGGIGHELQQIGKAISGLKKDRNE